MNRTRTLLLFVAVLFAGYGIVANQWTEYDFNVPEENQIQRSEELAEFAEMLFNVKHYDYSYEVIQESLRLDPTNLRARFYGMFIPALEHIRGIYSRMAPLLKKTPKLEEAFRQTKIEIKGHGLKEFFFYGGQPFSDEMDLNNYLVALADRLSQMRSQLDSLSGQKLTLYSNFSDEASIHIFENCSVERLGPLHYRVRSCSHVDRRAIALGYGDWQALKLRVAMAEFQLLAIASYSLTDIMPVLDTFSQKINNLKGGSGEPNVLPHFTETINKHPDFGKLLFAARLKRAMDVAKESFPAMEYVSNKELIPCTKKFPYSKYDFAKNERVLVDPMTDDQKNTLSGKSLFRDLPIDSIRDICSLKPKQGLLEILNKARYWDTFDYTIKMAEKRIPVGVGNYRGRIVKTIPAQEYTTRLNFGALVNGSINDIRQVLPNRYDQCGNILSFPDNTMAGFLPKGDLRRAGFFTSVFDKKVTSCD